MLQEVPEAFHGVSQAFQGRFMRSKECKEFQGRTRWFRGRSGGDSGGFRSVLRCSKGFHGLSGAFGAFPGFQRSIRSVLWALQGDFLYFCINERSPRGGGGFTGFQGVSRGFHRVSKD